MIKWVTKCDVFRTVVSSQCWSWNSSTVATWCEELLIRKDLDAGTDWRQEEKGMTEDEMVGWLSGHEFEQTPGDSGQGRLACYCPWCHKQSDTTEPLNNNNNWFMMCSILLCSKVIQLHTYVFFFIFFSIMFCLRTLNILIVLCAIQ